MNTVSTSSVAEVFDMNSDNFDSLEFLLKYEISTLPLEQKVLLKSKISRPPLDLSQKDGKIVRKFQKVWYSKYRWLSGCKRNKTLHCYYCLMFNGEEPWSKVGVGTI